MSQVLSKRDADKLVFSYQPKKISLATSEQAAEFVEAAKSGKRDFDISPIVAEASGVADLKRKQDETKIEAAVLERIKDIQEEAYQKAYELGLREGAERAFNEASGDISARIGRIDEVLHVMDNLKDNLVKENESGLVKLVFHIAERVIRKEVSEDQELVVGLIRSLLEDLRKDEEIVLKVSVSDFEFLTSAKEKISKKEEDLNNLKIVPVETMEPGGCILETNYGSIDASLEERVLRAWGAIDRKRPNLKGHSLAIDIGDSPAQDSGLDTASDVGAEDKQADDSGDDSGSDSES